MPDMKLQNMELEDKKNIAMQCAVCYKEAMLNLNLLNPFSRLKHCFQI